MGIVLALTLYLGIKQEKEEEEGAEEGEIVRFGGQVGARVN